MLMMADNFRAWVWHFYYQSTIPHGYIIALWDKTHACIWTYTQGQAELPMSFLVWIKVNGHFSKRLIDELAC